VTNPFEDQKLVLQDCTERFERLRIPYMLTGSMAMIPYAMMRMTRDIDIVVELRSTDAQRIIDEFEPDYYVPHGRVREAISRQRMFNLLHQATVVKVDCVIRKDNEFQKNVFERRRRITLSGIELWIISKEDLILSKLNWAKDTKSEVQMRDVASIIRNGYDEAYVQLWVQKLSLSENFGEVKHLLEQNYVDGHDA
jgi:predicted nucleotidyltransferase